jgi:hypothetical protein
MSFPPGSRAFHLGSREVHSGSRHCACVTRDVHFVQSQRNEGRLGSARVDAVRGGTTPPRRPRGRRSRPA